MMRLRSVLYVVGFGSACFANSIGVTLSEGRKPTSSRSAMIPMKDSYSSTIQVSFKWLQDSLLKILSFIHRRCQYFWSSALENAALVQVVARRNQTWMESDSDPWTIGGDGDLSLPDVLVAVGQVALARPKLVRRGAEVVDRMNAARRLRRAQRAEGKAAKAAANAEATVQLIRDMHLEVASTVGLPSSGKRSMTTSRAVAIIRSCFSASASSQTALRRQQLSRCEAGLTHLMLLHVGEAMRGPNGLIGWAAEAKSKGYSLVMGWMHEWDETRQWLKNLTNMSKRNVDRASRLADLARMTAARFQQSQAGDILVQSGKVVMAAVSPRDEIVTREAHWHRPPLSMSGKSSGHILQALKCGMPFDFADRSVCEDLLGRVDLIIGCPLADKASANVCAMASLRSVSEQLPNSYMLDEEFCELHNCNNLKAANQEYVQMVSSFFGLANLMRSSDYVAACVRRLTLLVQTRLTFNPPGRQRDLAVVLENQKLADRIFDLEGDHHKRYDKKGHAFCKLRIGTHVCLANCVHVLCEIDVWCHLCFSVRWINRQGFAI